MLPPRTGHSMCLRHCLVCAPGRRSCPQGSPGAKRSHRSCRHGASAPFPNLRPGKDLVRFIPQVARPTCHDEPSSYPRRKARLSPTPGEARRFLDRGPSTRYDRGRVRRHGGKGLSPPFRRQDRRCRGFSSGLCFGDFRREKRDIEEQRPRILFWPIMLFSFCALIPDAPLTRPVRPNDSCAARRFFSPMPLMPPRQLLTRGRGRASADGQTVRSAEAREFCCPRRVRVVY